MAIVANAVALGVELDYRPEDAQNQVAWWFVLDSMFTTIFCVECALRIAVDRWSWHRDPWNLFDAFLALLGIVDTWLLFLVFLGTDQSTDMRMLTATRLLRLLRLSRMLRILRIVRFFKELVVLARAIGSAAAATFWSAMLLGMLILFFGLFLARFVGHHCCDEDSAFTDEQFHEWFGTLPRCLFTLFATATKEEWTGVARAAFSQGVPGIVLVLLILLFVLVTHLVVMNLVAGFFIENVLEVAEVESLKAKLEIQNSHRERVWHLFDCDSDSVTGVLEWGELLEPAPPERESSIRDSITRAFGSLSGGVDGPLSGRISQTSFRSNDSQPRTLSKLELAARYAAVSPIDIKDIFNCLDVKDNGTVDRVEFARELGAATDDPAARQLEELKSAVIKARSRTRDLAHQLKEVEAEACSLAEARLFVHASGNQAPNSGKNSQTLEPELEQLRAEALAHIRETEGRLAEAIPAAASAMRLETLRRLRDAEERVLEAGGEAGGMLWL